MYYCRCWFVCLCIDLFGSFVSSTKLPCNLKGIYIKFTLQLYSIKLSFVNKKGFNCRNKAFSWCVIVVFFYLSYVGMPCCYFGDTILLSIFDRGINLMISQILHILHISFCDSWYDMISRSCVCWKFDWDWSKFYMVWSFNVNLVFFFFSGYMHRS